MSSALSVAPLLLHDTGVSPTRSLEEATKNWKEQTTWEQPRSPSYTKLKMDRCLTHIGREGEAVKTVLAQAELLCAGWV